LSFYLKILRKSFANTRVAVCDSFVAPDGKVYYTPGVKMARLNNYLGCDSVISIDLHILKTDTAFVVQVCDSFKAPDGKVYKQSGDIVAVIPNAAGCDSTMHIRVERLNTESAMSINACRQYTAPDGKIYRQSGNYFAKLSNVRGCDSAISIQLSIDTVEVEVGVQDSILTAVADGATYQWLYCDSNYLPVPGATNKIYKARRNGRYSVAVTQDNCTDTSDCYTISSLSLSKHSNWAVTMYPNPTDGRFTIFLDDFVKELNISIRDINGKTVYHTTVYDTQELTLQPALPAGVYSLSLQSSKGEGVYKLIRL
jgi:phosphoribosylpyrophosphate synthetase